jgi:hypothetical protein
MPTVSPISARKLRANRLNARKSTGPRTEAGKARSSRNATTHGLFCSGLVMPGEDEETFLEIRDGLLDGLKPTDTIELLLVDRIVGATWKLRRLQQAELILSQREARRMRDEAAERAREIRSQIEADDRLDRCSSRDDDDGDDDAQEDEREWRKHFVACHARSRRELLDAKRRCAQIDRDEVPSAEFLASRLDVETQDGGREGQLDRLSLYEQRLENSIHRNLRELDRLRKRRRLSDQDEHDARADASCASPRDRRGARGSGWQEPLHSAPSAELSYPPRAQQGFSQSPATRAANVKSEATTRPADRRTEPGPVRRDVNVKNEATAMPADRRTERGPGTCGAKVKNEATAPSTSANVFREPESCLAGGVHPGTHLNSRDVLSCEHDPTGDAPPTPASPTSPAGPTGPTGPAGRIANYEDPADNPATLPRSARRGEAPLHQGIRGQTHHSRTADRPIQQQNAASRRAPQGVPSGPENTIVTITRK